MPVDAARSGGSDRGLAGRVTGLLQACHPGPAAGVTALATLLALGAGAGARTVLLVTLALAVGQLSIGWSNDWIDAARDLAVDRADKPVAAGRVSRRAVGRAALAAAVLTVPVSFTLGPRAGLAHVVAVASGWAYNAGLKGTAWSWAPYALTFGLLPAVVTLALPGHPWPAPWAMGAGALLGVGAHLVNVLPDLDDDAATGVRGLPHRLGRPVTSVLAPVAFVLASLLVVLGPPGPASAARWGALVLVAAFGTLAVGAAVRGGGRRLPLLATVLVAVVDAALLLSSGASLTR